MKHKASSFLELLNNFVTEYLPSAVGASANTIKSYKAAFRLLLKYMYQERGISADQMSFETLNYQTMLDFLSWIEKSRGCSATTKNQRLRACQHLRHSPHMHKTGISQLHRHSEAVSQGFR